MNEEDAMIANYLGLIEERLIKPIREGGVSEWCTVSLLLVFAGIDALSKITCEDMHLGSWQVGERFKGFLSNQMGSGYADRAARIYQLRNSIVHTGINEKVTLSKAKVDANHLEYVDGQLWVNTTRFVSDFVSAFERIVADVRSRGEFFHQARKRLSRFTIVTVEDSASSSPGPSVSVI